MKRTIHFLIGWIFLLSLPWAANAAEWHLGKDADGVRVYSRDAADGSIEVKAETTLDVPLASVMALIVDYDAATRWRSEMIKSMKLKDHPNDQTWILQVHAEPPWPLPASDNVIEAVLYAEPEQVVYKYKERPDLQPPGTTSALGAMNGEWILRPAGPQRTKVISVMFMKPSVPVPNWLIKRMVYNTPHEQMLKMGKVVQEPQYRPAAVSPKLKELLAPTLKSAISVERRASAS